MSDASSKEISATIERLCALRVLAPDAEADACGSAFQSWAYDRMDEWHAALAAHDGRSTDGLERQVVLVRSAAELCALVASRPPSDRTNAVCSAAVDARKWITPSEAEAISALRTRWLPAFLQSASWQAAVGLLWPEAPVPWVVLACREVLRAASPSERARPSLFAPWLSMMGRGAWPMPLGDGAVALWVPRADDGAAGVDRAMRAASERAFSLNALRRFGLREPSSYTGPGSAGVEYFGLLQSARIDPEPPHVLRPRLAEEVPREPAAQSEMVRLGPINPPPGARVIAAPVLGSDIPEALDGSLVDRLRRWWQML